MKNNWKKNITIFIVSQTISIFGSTLVQHAITWYVTLQTQSGIYSTIAILCGFLPVLFISPFSGVWADKYDRKKLIAISDGGIAFCTLLLAIAYMLGFGNIWLLFGASIVRSIGQSVQTPCTNAVIPDIVPEEHLTRVNGINGTLQSFIMLLSPALAGVLMKVSSIQMILMIDVITAIIALTILALFLEIPKKEISQQDSQNNHIQELKQGINYIRKHKYLQSFFLYMAIFCMMASPAAFLTPLQIVRAFGDNVTYLTTAETAWAVGMLLGGIVISVWQGFKNRIHTLALSLALMGLCTIALGFPKYFWLYIGFMGLFGFSMPFFNTPGMVILQENVEPEYMGRVFSIMSMVNSTMMPLGMVIFGPLADFIKIEWLLIGTGIIIAITTFFLLRDKALLEIGKPKDTKSI